jgi:hypothetical protein
LATAKITLSEWTFSVLCRGHPPVERLQRFGHESRVVKLYDESYAVSTLRAQLQEEADRFGEEPLERRHAAWQRLLATFRMVHGGVQHEQLRLPAYGGGLFDPDRFPFLERRKPGVNAAAEPVPIDDRTVLHLLDALQVLRRRGRRAGPTEAQRLSYRALDVEQIGHVYEGLLDHTAVRADDPALGLDGKLEPEVPLRRVEQAAARGRDALVAWLGEQTGESRAWVERRLDADLKPAERQRLRAACDNDPTLTDRVAPFGGLLRRDLRGDPLVYLPGSTYVTKAGERRSSGTYCTPRALAEEVVGHTLDPLVYQPGPAENADPASLLGLWPGARSADAALLDQAEHTPCSHRLGQRGGLEAGWRRHRLPRHPRSAHTMASRPGGP